MLAHSQVTPLALAVILTSCVLFSCSDNGSPADPDVSGAGPVGVATITPSAGGIVVAKAADGATVTLTFPPGAVGVDTDVTVRTLAPTGDDWVAVVLEPAGMVFYDYFDIDVTIPDGVVLTDAQLFLRPSDPVHIGTTVSGRTLMGSLSFFGFADDSTWVIPGASPMRLASGGNGLGAGPVSCQQLIVSTQLRFDGFLALNEYERAIESALNISGILQRNNCPGAQDWIDQAAQIACDQLDATIQDVQSTPTVSYGDFVQQGQEILDWVAVAQRLDPSCPGVTNFLTALDGEISDFITFYQPKLGALTAFDWGAFQDLKEEAVSIFKLMTTAQSLGLFDAYDKLDSDAFRPTVDNMRTIAYEMCKSGGWHYPLSRLTSTGFFAARDIVGVTPPRPSQIISGLAPSRYANFTDDDIFEDMQYCATDLSIESLVASGGQLDSTTAGSNGSAGNKTDRVTIEAPTRGEIELGKQLKAFSCWDDEDGDKEIIIALDGTDVLTLRRPIGQDDYLQGGPERINLGAAATAAMITPKEGNTHDLTIRRERPNCDDRLWGESSYTIATATLQWKNPTLTVDVTLPPNVQVGDVVPVDIRVGVVDQANQTGYFELIDVDVDVTGGSPPQVSGQTDSQGYFRPMVTVDTPTLSSGQSPSMTANLSINAKATSFEDVTAQGSASASVGAGTANLQSVGHCGTVRVFGLGQETIERGDHTAVGTWTFDKSVSDNGVNGSLSFDATATTNATTTVTASGTVLTSFTGSITSNTQLTASGDFPSLPSSIADAEMSLFFEVVGGGVAFTLTGDASVTGTYDTWIQLSGPITAGFARTRPPDIPPTVNESGILPPGLYSMSVFAGSVSRCTDCTENSTITLNFSLTLGSN